MKPLHIFTFSIFIFIATCGSRPEPTLPTATITPILSPVTETPTARPEQVATVEYWFSPANLEEYLLPLDSPLFDFVENQQDSKAWLFVNAIYAIDKDTVFWGGSLDFSDNGFFRRSVLLRSLDGGKNWKEAMPTARVSEVEHIAFLDQGEGWALVPGVGELGSIMPTMLWHTANFGETWEIAGRVSPASDYTRSYMTLKFYTSTHGEVSFVCDGSNLCGGSNYYSIQTTENGGVSWQESYHLALPVVEGDPWHDKRLQLLSYQKVVVMVAMWENAGTITFRNARLMGRMAVNGRLNIRKT